MNVETIGGDSPIAPHPVSRGAKIQTGFLGIDSLYLVFEYPFSDVFKFWSSIAEQAPEEHLFDGIPFEEFLVRRGGNGYKLSVWDGDARLYMTDRVDEALADSPNGGQGMGVMLQLGPKWLRHYAADISFSKLINNVLAQAAVFGVLTPAEHPARLNRIDIALDVIGLAVADFSIDQWRSRWVGYAQQKHFHDAAVTGALTGLSIGSSTGSVRFKVYDKVLESLKSGSSAFWRSVWDVTDDEPVSVARFEWSIRPYSGRFTNARYLTDLSPDTFNDLLNYASLKWGRLCIPQEGDTNKSRWPLDPLWADIRAMIDAWTFGHEGMASRTYEFTPDLNQLYVRSFAGWFGGFMARLGIERRQNVPASIGDALQFLTDEGLAPSNKAHEKWQLFSRQLGRNLE